MPIIARVLQETAGLPAEEVQARLREAYPFGARANHPYRVWREEIRRQGGPRLIIGRPPNPVRPSAKRPSAAGPPASPGVRPPRSAGPPRPPSVGTDSVSPTADSREPAADKGSRLLAPSSRLRSDAGSWAPGAGSRPTAPLTAEADLPPQLMLGCRTCAHLGALCAVTDIRGARRLRRHCSQNPLGWTDIDWPACPCYQARAPEKG